ncbi:MAG: ParB/RepB/Spo0J family partition protein [Bacteroidota bacterium]
MAKKVKRKEIGKGIGALLSSISSEPEAPPKEEVVKELSHTVAEIPIDAIEVNPFQPRKDFDEEALQELATSLKVHGLIQPITVRRMSAGSYQLISGERRLRASKLAGLTDLPAYIRLANDQEMLEMALLENIQRENLNAIEVAITYQRLIDECQLTHETLADRMGKKRSSVTNYLRLLKLPPTVQTELKKGSISMGHARALVSIEDTVLQLRLLNETITKELSVRALEKLVKSYIQGVPSSSKAAKSLSTEYENVRSNLQSYLDTKVDLKMKGRNKGQILINFDSVKTLNRILGLIED